MPSIFSRIQQYDLQLVQRVHRYHSALLDRIMMTLTYFGDWGWWWALVSGIFFLLPEYEMVGKKMLLAFFCAAILSEWVLKPIFRRRRPFLRDDTILPRISLPRGYSFPSSHSVMSWAVSMVYICTLPWGAMSWLLLLVAVGVSISRFYLQVHFLSDVIIGVLIGGSLAVMIACL